MVCVISTKQCIVGTSCARSGFTSMVVVWASGKIIYNLVITLKFLCLLYFPCLYFDYHLIVSFKKIFVNWLVIPWLRQFDIRNLHDSYSLLTGDNFYSEDKVKRLYSKISRHKRKNRWRKNYHSLAWWSSFYFCCRSGQRKALFQLTTQLLEAILNVWGGSTVKLRKVSPRR